MSAPTNPIKRSDWLDAAITGATLWYLTGLMLFLGFSFGFMSEGVTQGRAGQSTKRWVERVALVSNGRDYKTIASGGYSYDPSAPSPVAFFPVYPLLGRAVHVATGISIEASLLIVSNASLLAAFILIVRYVRQRFPIAPPELAESVLLSLGLFPTSCFFRVAYSEATFLLVTVAALYALERRWPCAACSAIIGLATATRPVGIALLAPLAIDIWRRNQSGIARTAALAFWLPLACWGLAVYMIYQFFMFGDPLAFAKSQEHWGFRAELAFPGRLWAWVTLEPIRAVYDSASPVYWATRDPDAEPWFNLQFANPIYFLAAVGLLAIGGAKHWLTHGEVALGGILLLIPYVTRGYAMGMSSTGRFVVVALPIFIVLGHIIYRLPRGIAASLTAISGLLAAVYAARYAAMQIIF
jgi:hypothetical protein